MRRTGLTGILLLLLLQCFCIAGAAATSWESLCVIEKATIWNASQFTADYLTDGYKLIRISEDQQILVIPEGADIPEGTPKNITIVKQPLEKIYMVSSSSMDYFRALDCVDSILLSSQKADSWYLPEARQAMEEGRMLYAGKYSTPDYEMILSAGCDLAVENTMINHTPEVREQLEQIGIPVIIDMSGYESDPLGRMEWIRLYGMLMNREEEADEFYRNTVCSLEKVTPPVRDGIRVAFFFITSNGTVNVRRSGDYVARAIAMAGGEYISFDEDASGSAMSTQTINMESFYIGALDADVLIYNSTIDGEVFTMSELLQKSPVLEDFQAVKQGNVWCLGKNFYQEPLALGNLILDINSILNDPDCPEDSLYFLHPVE